MLTRYRHSSLQVIIAAFLFLVAILVATTAAQAEIIHLLNGNKLEGFVQDRYDGKVFILTASGQIVLPESEIDFSRMAPPVETALSGVSVYLDSGHLLSATREIASVLEEARRTEAEVSSDKNGAGDEAPQPYREQLIALLVDREDRVAAMMREADPAEGEAALTVLESLIEVTPAFDSEIDPAASESAPDAAPPVIQLSDEIEVGYVFALARWQIEMGHGDAALASLEALLPKIDESQRYPAAVRKMLKEREARARRLVGALAMRFEATGELDNMDRALEVLRLVDPRGARAVSAWAWIAQAGEKREQGEYGAALTIYRDKVSDVLPNLTRERIAMTLETAGARLAPANEYDELVTLEAEFGPYSYVRTDDEAAATYVARLRRLLEQAAEQALTRGDTELAAKHFRRIAELPADEETDRDWEALAEFASRRIELGPGDHLGRYKLAIWAGDRGLYEPARNLLKDLEAVPALAENVRLQRQVFQREEELQQFELTTKAADEERFDDAIRLAEEFLQKYPLSQHRQQMRRLRNAAINDLSRETYQKPHQALSKYDQAERLYYLQKYEEALSMLDEVLIDFAETPAAKQARRLKRDLLQRQYGNLLENNSTPRSESTLTGSGELASLFQPGQLEDPELRDELLRFHEALEPYFSLLLD